MNHSPKSFASDNNAPVHERVLQAISDVNRGDAISYGDDVYTLEAEQHFKALFGKDVKVFLMLTGTGANAASLAHITQPYHAIVSADTAHLENDECGAPEKITSCKLITLPAQDAKIRPEQLYPLMESRGFQHHAQPKVVSITQSTELGTVYKPKEIKQIASFAHDNDLYLHMDGARIANAAASLDISLAEMVTYTGVDVLSFGATKNGAMAAEAVVFLEPSLGQHFEYTRKQNMQLTSKMRYVSAQFNALFTNDLWLHNARHANAMAKRLAEGIQDINNITITQPVESNAVFARLPLAAIEKLQRQYSFYVWDKSKNEVRWMTAYHTTVQDVDEFIAAVKDAV